MGWGTPCQRLVCSKSEPPNPSKHLTVCPGATFFRMGCPQHVSGHFAAWQMSGSKRNLSHFMIQSRSIFGWFGFSFGCFSFFSFILMCQSLARLIQRTSLWGIKVSQKICTLQVQCWKTYERWKTRGSTGNSLTASTTAVTSIPAMTYGPLLSEELGLLTQ